MPSNKRPGPVGFTGEFYHKFREELKTILLNFFLNTAEEGKLPSSFWVHQQSNTKPKVATKKKKHYRLISLMNIDAKILNKILANTIQEHIKGLFIWPSVFYPRDARILPIFTKKFNMMYHINKLKDKNHIVISIDEEKGFNKI